MSYLPTYILETSFEMHEEFAWKKENINQVISFCSRQSIAIVSVEAWIVRKVEDCDDNEPILPIHNLDPTRNQLLSVLGRTQDYVIWGLFPLKNGKKTLLSWGLNRDKQSWKGFVQKALTETKRIIFEGNLEEEIIPKYAPFVYYNLIFELEDGTSF